MPDKIRIAFFCPNLGGGGAEMHLARLLSNLNNDIFDLHLIVSRSGGSYLSLLPDHVTVHLANKTNISSGVIGMLRTIYPLSKKLTAIEPDLFVSVMDHSNIMAYYAHQRSNSSSKLVFCVQTPILQSLKFSWNPVNQFLRWMMPFVYPYADKIISLSVGVRNDLISISKKLRDNTVVINNIGIDQQKKEASKTIPQSDKKRVVICGRLIKLKGFDDALRCIKIIAETIDVELWVIGDGPEKNNLISLSRELNIEDRIKWLGFVSHPEELMAQADLFLLCSYYEGFGNVIIEAMSVGLPVISTDCPYGPGEIIDNKVSGVLVPVGDYKSMADEALNIFSNPILTEQVVKNAYQRVGDFSKEKITEQYEKLFEQVV